MSGGTVKSPWRVGWESARANFVPGLILQLGAAALVVSYYAFPGFRAALGPVARWQEREGWVAVLLSRGFFCGLLPGAFLAAMPSIRPRRFLATLAAVVPWWAFAGLVVSWMYADQEMLFGAGRDIATLLKKTCFDQFVFTALYAAPVTAAFNFWVGRDLSLRRARAEWPAHPLRDLVLPTLLPNWAVWFPAMTVIYALPEPLQVHVSGIVGCFWSLMCLQIGVRTGPRGTRREGDALCG